MSEGPPRKPFVPLEDGAAVASNKSAEAGPGAATTGGAGSSPISKRSTAGAGAAAGAAIPSAFGRLAFSSAWSMKPRSWSTLEAFCLHCGISWHSKRSSDENCETCPAMPSRPCCEMASIACKAFSLVCQSEVESFCRNWSPTQVASSDSHFRQNSSSAAAEGATRGPPGAQSSLTTRASYSPGAVWEAGAVLDCVVPWAPHRPCAPLPKPPDPESPPP
mmetsp:Transcript_26198/g.55517  ORF Transcript_26198/g.55517 Transcript_26198/m.55517 type:complete len:219 (-) Transcript_26198:901-1557(-)